MSSLTQKTCQACEGGTPALTPAHIQTLLSDVAEWSANDTNTAIERRFSFPNFLTTMNFVNALAFLAEQEGHHPDLKVGYGYCHVTFSTHSVKGLTENDFICAAKINQMIS